MGHIELERKIESPHYINGVQIQKEQTGPRTELGYLLPF